MEGARKEGSTMDEKRGSTAISEGDRARIGEPHGGSIPVPPRPEATVYRSRWTAGRITAVVVGSLLGFVSLVLLGSGGTVLWADLTKRDGGYLTTENREFSTPGSALATVSTELGSAGTGWLYPPALLDEVRIRVTPTGPGPALFVGVGPSTEVDRYLAGVHRTVISDFWTGKVQDVEGGHSVASPGTQDFWVASSSGPGPRTLLWDPADGSWTVVVMNADGRHGVRPVATDLGATAPAVVWIALGVLVAGVVFLAGGVLLIVGAFRRGTHRPMTA
jgi:hypothetical protein